MERQAIPGRLASLIVFLALFWMASVAHAHPHMWIDAKASLGFDAQGRLAAIHQTWQFDEMSSVYSLQGLAKDKQGQYRPKDLQSMADDWVAALGEPQSHYFTRVAVGGKPLAFGKPRKASVKWDKAAGRLALSFELPLAQPVQAKVADIDIYDPTFFVAYAFEDKDAVTLDGAPAACTSQYRPPRELDWKTLQRLAAIPAEQEHLPEELFAITQSLTHRIEVRCS